MSAPAALLLLPWIASGGEPVVRPRLAVVGTDTSHAGALAEAFRAASPGAPTIVKAFPGGSPDIPSSRDRVAGFAAALRDRFGVALAASVEEAVRGTDGVMLLAGDGRRHLEYMPTILAAGVPVFVDKPVAASLEDAVRLFALAERAGVPCWSSSALRFEGYAQQALARRAEALGADAFSPAPTGPHHPDLFWYGVHGAELLFCALGTDCRSVRRTAVAGTDVVTGVWGPPRAERVGTLRGTRSGKWAYGLTRFGPDGVTQHQGFGGYRPLAAALATFFRTRRPPVTAEETLAIYAFMAAAEESKRRGGSAVGVPAILATARAAAGPLGVSRPTRGGTHPGPSPARQPGVSGPAG